MEQIVYKVARIYGGRPCSAWIFQNSDYFVEYLVGEWVEAPEGTLLFAFSELADAKNYAVRVGYGRIYIAMGRDVKSWEVAVFAGTLASDDRMIKAFWKSVAKGKPLHNLINTPRGTLGCKAIRLDGEIEGFG